SAAPLPLEAQVAELLEACQRAVADGEYAKARQLAERAVALDPECMAANALLLRSHLLTHARQARPTENGEETASCPAAETPGDEECQEQEPQAAYDPSLDCTTGTGEGCHGSELLSCVRHTLEQINGFDIDLSESGCVRIRCDLPLGMIECCFD